MGTKESHTVKKDKKMYTCEFIFGMTSESSPDYKHSLLFSGTRKVLVRDLLITTETTFMYRLRPVTHPHGHRTVSRRNSQLWCVKVNVKLFFEIKG